MTSKDVLFYTVHVLEYIPQREKRTAGNHGKAGAAMQKSKIKPYLFLIPGLLLLVVFVFYPIVRNVEYSFLKWDLFSGEKTFIWFENYQKLFSSKEFPIAFKNNILYVVISLVFQVGVALIFAAFLENMKRRRLSAVFRTTFFIPSLISLTIIGLLFTFIYKPNGLLNSLLEVLNLGHLATGWLGNKSTAIYAVIAVSQWKSIGYTMMLLIVAIQRIPHELYEAATIDGASKLTTFFRITVPQIAGMLRIAIIINVSGGLLVFNEIFIMTNGGPGGASEVLSTLMYKNAFVHGKVGYASAIATVILVLSLVFSILQYVRPGGSDDDTSPI